MFVKVCDPVKVVTTAVSIAIASADTEIPVPPIAFIVAAPDVDPPVKPAPATTLDMSPSAADVTSEYFASLIPPAVLPSWTIKVSKVVSTVISPASPVNELC